MALTPGTRLGPYEITAQIGEGGMGAVYRATDTNLSRQVAIKVLPDAFAQDAERLARFEREAKTLASLNHPHIAAIYGFEKSGGTHALVMELVEGDDLSQRIARGAIPMDEALPMAKQIAEALEAAHEQGIIHRDLKPANIKVRDDGTVKVLDFGLAKAMEPAAGSSPSLSVSPTITTPAMTHAGMILGTAAYMSPEQARGKSADKRADIWAFGCVLYEMLTGRRAFEDEDVSMTLSKVLQREPDFETFPANVPSRVRQTVRLCLRKSLRERVPDIGAVRLALDGAFETAASHVAQSVAVAQTVWRRPLAVAGATAIVAILVTGLAAWSLWPTVAPPAVNRFDYVLPQGQQFRNTGRPVMAFSPDGRHFVYNTTAGLYLRTMGELEARLIPGTNVDLTNPFFSPDGQSVGYWDRAATQLKRIAVSGGAPVVIGAARVNINGASWAADGTILFGQPEGIMRVPANGGTPELVIKANQGEVMDGPQLLPDEESVLFSVTTGAGEARWDAAQIVVQSLATGMRTVVVQGGSDARYLPTGHLVYALEDGLFAVAFDVDRLAMTGGAVPLVQGVMRAVGTNTAAANYGVSDSGTLVYVSGGAAFESRTLVWVDRAGREEALKVPPRPYAYPRLSPDRTRIALDMRDDENIWIWDVAREALTRLTLSPRPDRAPVWTPDGTRVAFRSAVGEAVGIYLQAADGSGSPEAVLQTNAEPARELLPRAFSPDGRQLLVTEGAPPRDISIVALDGTRTVRPLVNTSFEEHNPEVSVDGRWLAYDSNESGQLEVYVRPFPDVSGGRTQASIGGGRHPLWSRDGRELFYWVEPGTVMAVPVVTGPKFSAGRPVVAVKGDYLRPYDPRQYDVSADGRRFLMIKSAPANGGEAAQPQVVIVENWLEELKRLVPTN